MKNSVFFLAMVFIGYQAIAQPGTHGNRRDGSEIVITLWDDSPFTVVFDHAVYNAPSNVFRLDNVEPGLHKLVVKQSKFGRYGEVVEILYRGDVRIPANSRLITKIGRHYNLEIIREERLGGAGHGGHGGHGGGYYNSGHGGYYGKPPLIFEDLKISLQNADFESDRRMIAEQAVVTNSVIADDIYRILMFFDFESTKLEFAKFAYPHCEDKNNFYRVNDAFSFSSSIRELNDYILTYGRRGGTYQYYDYHGGH